MSVFIADALDGRPATTSGDRAMLLAVSALKGYVLSASDGRIGTVSDVLFDDRTWRLRWLLVDTGPWPTGRHILIHPSAMGKADHDAGELPVALTKAQVEGSPSVDQDRPVSLQMQARLYGYYEADPMWGGSGYFGAGPGPLSGMLASPYYDGAGTVEALDEQAVDEGDPHLRSAKIVVGSHIHATDGKIGHVENMLVDDAGWDIRYLIVDTSNWWFGRHVLLAPYAATGITWEDHSIEVNVTRERVKGSPPWDPVAMIDRVYEKKLHRHYGWSGYNF